MVKSCIQYHYFLQGKYKGIYCIPRKEEGVVVVEEGVKCCGISHNYTASPNDTVQACHDKIKKFGLGDKQIEGCKWGYDEEFVGPSNWHKW